MSNVERTFRLQNGSHESRSFPRCLRSAQYAAVGARARVHRSMFSPLSHDDEHVRHGRFAGKSSSLILYPRIFLGFQQGNHTQVDITGGLTQQYSPIINLTTNPAGIITTFSVSTSMHCAAFGHSTGFFVSEVKKTFETIDVVLGTIHLLYKNDPQCCFNYQSTATQFANPVSRNGFSFSSLDDDDSVRLATRSESRRSERSVSLVVQRSRSPHPVETSVRYAETMDETGRSVNRFSVDSGRARSIVFVGRRRKFRANFSTTCAFSKA